MAITATPAASRGPVLISLSSISISLAISTTILRFVLRRRSDSRIGPDDYAIAVACAVSLVGTVLSIMEASSKTSSSALEFDVLGQPWLMTGATLSEISIYLSFIGMLTARRWRTLLVTIISLMAVVNIIFSLTANLQCRPLEKLWSPQTDGSCWNPSVQLDLGYSQGAFSIFSWFFLSLFPVMILRELDTQYHPRWAFYVLSGFTFAVGILAAARTYETSHVDGLGVYSFDTACAEILAVLEQNMGIVAANVLTTAAFFSRTARKNAAALRGKSPSRAESSLATARATSRASSRRGLASSTSSSLVDTKHPTTLVIDGSGRASHDTAREYEMETSSIRSLKDSYGDPEAWARGIVKTVRVEVFEEDNPDAEAAKETADGAISRTDETGIEQDWETMLRSGPAPRRA